MQIIDLSSPNKNFRIRAGFDLAFMIRVKDQDGDPVDLTTWQSVSALFVRSSDGEIIQALEIGDGLEFTLANNELVGVLLGENTLDMPVGCDGAKYQIAGVTSTGLHVDLLHGRLFFATNITPP